MGDVGAEVQVASTVKQRTRDGPGRSTTALPLGGSTDQQGIAAINAKRIRNHHTRRGSVLYATGHKARRPAIAEPA